MKSWRYFLLIYLLVCSFPLITIPGFAEEPKINPSQKKLSPSKTETNNSVLNTKDTDTKESHEKLLERRVYHSLREIHNQGADFYNRQESLSCFYLMKGGLLMSRDVLAHRLDIKKMIDDGLKEANKRDTIEKKAFALHELIERVRSHLREKYKKPIIIESETLNVFPRELTPEDNKNFETIKSKSKELGKQNSIEKKSAENGKISPKNKTWGVSGQVIFEGRKVAHVEISFVSLDQKNAKTYKTTSGKDGAYFLEVIPDGRYAILLKPGKNCSEKVLPKRYEKLDDSPLVFMVQGKSERIDFMLKR